MNEWPQGWTGDNRRGYPYGGYGGGYGGQYQPEPPLPPGMSPRGATVPGQQQGGWDDYADDGYSPGHVYGGRGGYADDPYVEPAPGWGRRFKRILITLLVVLLVVVGGTYFWADSKLRKEVDLSKVEGRPAPGEGTNYLVVGSDSREGMSAGDKKRLHTGSAAGKRTDSMMILHVGSNGTTMMSLPRDWYVTIPAFTGSVSGKRIPSQKQKLNTAYAIEGPELLVRTIEYNTGLHIDHYAEIGFGGFANIVDALGGVEMCFDKSVKDKNSGADFKAGCQQLNGTRALAFVRNRYSLPGGDLDRAKNQRKLLAALAKEAATPSTVLNPFKLYPTMGAGLDSLVVDKDMGPISLLRMFWAMKGVSGGDGKQLNLPTIPGGNAPGVGSVLKWDEPKAKKLLNQLKNDEKVTVSN